MRLRRSPFVAALALTLAAAALAGSASDGTGKRDDPRHVSATPSARTAAPDADGVSGAGTVDRGRVVRFVLPSLADAKTDPNAANFARHGPPDAPLVLFLPATGAKPRNYQAFLDAAADARYSVLGLDYFNIGRSLTRTCGADASCYDRFQRNRFDGTDPSRFSRVDAANSILTRLTQAIAYLEQHDPRGDWGRFLDDGEKTGIRWSEVVVAGHSQGGGEAAFISHYHRVKGVLMFSSPVETFQDVSAQWMETPGATPPSLMYGFDLESDMYHDRIVPSWAKLGMGSPPEPTAPGTEASEVPTGSHTLVSDREVGTPREAHGRSISDGGPRTDGGVPLFRPTWEWMLRQVR